jgi:hypothetical protein
MSHAKKKLPKKHIVPTPARHSHKEHKFFPFSTKNATTQQSAKGKGRQFFHATLKKMKWLDMEKNDHEKPNRMEHGRTRKRVRPPRTPI